MSDYRINVTVRNARLLRAIENAGHQPGLKFANAVGISYSNCLLPYMNLTRSPLQMDGLLRECAWALCDFLSASPSDLWSDEQLTPLKKNHSSIDIDGSTLRDMLSGDDPAYRLAAQSQAKKILASAVSALSEREAMVIKGIYEDDLTRVDLAEKMLVTPERIKQIEGNALMKLRRLSIKKILPNMDGMANVIGDVSHE